MSKIKKLIAMLMLLMLLLSMAGLTGGCNLTVKYNGHWNENGICVPDGNQCKVHITIDTKTDNYNAI